RRWVGRRAATRWTLARNGRALAGSGRLQPCEFLDFNGRQGQPFDGRIAQFATDSVEFAAVFFVVDAAVDGYARFHLDPSTAVVVEVPTRPFHRLAGTTEA